MYNIIHKHYTRNYNYIYIKLILNFSYNKSFQILLFIKLCNLNYILKNVHSFMYIIIYI